MTDTRRRTRGAGSVFRDKNGTWHYRRELDRDPATGRPRRIEAKGRTKAEARTRFDAKAAEMERTGLIARREVATVEGLLRTMAGGL